MNPTLVYLLHAVDTEGPLYEAPLHTVERVNSITGLRLPVTLETHAALREGRLELGDRAAVVSTILRYSTFLGDWGAVRDMIARVTSPAFRQAHADSEGNPWRFNWHVMDHVGYDVNPRRRDIGFHNIFDFYADRIRDTGSGDQLGFHFHPDHFYPHAHMSGITFSTSRFLYSILVRRLIDRNWFPRSYRAGFHTERPDSHLFLEQWIPNDFSNQAIEGDRSADGQQDVGEHRFGDWMRAPTRWGHYHPSHDDYQVEGSCRRRIFRCLSIGTRVRCIAEADVEKAFRQAKETQRPLVVCVTNHDFRDMAPDIEWLKRTFDRHAERSGIGWRSATIDDTFEDVRSAPVRSSFRLERRGSLTRLYIEYASPIFGPQPFLAMKLVNEQYHHVNFDIVEPFRRFTFSFDENSVPIEKVEKIAVATNDRGGNVVIDRVKD